MKQGTATHATQAGMAAGWTEKDDNELLRLIQQGSRHAFAILVERYSRRFYAVAYRFVRQQQMAEDVVQDAFIKLWETPWKWNEGEGAKFTTWFYRVVVNRCFDLKRKTRTTPLENSDAIIDEAEDQEELLQQRQQQVALSKAIDSLPQRQQIAVNLCYSDGISQQEAADIMEIKLKALESLLSRAKATLRETLKHYR